MFAQAFLSEYLEYTWHHSFPNSRSQLTVTCHKHILIKNFQRVILPVVNSDWSKMTAGVQLGSILGPLIFLISKTTCSCIRLFADDTNLFIIVEVPFSKAERINAD